MDKIPINRIILFSVIVSVLFALFIGLAYSQNFQMRYANYMGKMGVTFFGNYGGENNISFMTQDKQFHPNNRVASPPEKARFAQELKRLPKADLLLFLRSEKQLNHAIEAAKRSGAGSASALNAFNNLTPWGFGFIPSMFLLALILASPVSLVRKGIALVLGFLAIHLFLILKLWIFIQSFYNVAPQLMMQSGSFGQSIIPYLVNTLQSVSFNMIVAAIIWLMVTFPGTDHLKNLLK